MAVTLAILPPSWVPGKQSAIYTVLRSVGESVHLTVWFVVHASGGADRLKM